MNWPQVVMTLLVFGVSVSLTYLSHGQKDIEAARFRAFHAGGMMYVSAWMLMELVGL